MSEKLHLNFCTLFDSVYMDKGLTMYESLEKNTDDYTLYIFAFDEKSYLYIRKMGLKNVVVISESEILDDNLRKLKEQRTRAEYCWTCTSVIINYVLNQLDCDNCTYLDSDIYFFSNPRILIEEMLQKEKEVLVTPHWFKKSLENFLIEKMYGRYCVQFNTFLATPDSQCVLKWWKRKCEEECSVSSKWKTFGDQKYQNEFYKISSKVHELEYYGGGMAPWNIGNYRLKNIDDRNIFVEKKDNNKEYLVVFYHFQGLKNIHENLYDLNVHTWQGNNVDEKLLYNLYSRYISHLNKIKVKIKDVNGDLEPRKVNLDIQKAKRIKPFECGIFKQVVMTIVGILERKRKQKYAKLDLMRF